VSFSSRRLSSEYSENALGGANSSGQGTGGMTWLGVPQKTQNPSPA
jgi:hypothetical protein